MSKKTLWRFVPFLSFVLISLFLYVGLYLNPHFIPSAIINKPLPKLDLPLLSTENGKTFNLNDYRGKVWLLNVWASWCIACREEHPVMMDIAHEGISVIGLDYKDDMQGALKWLNDFGSPYQAVLFDKAGNRAIDLGVYGAPETFVIDKELKIRYKHVGVLTHQVWLNKIKPLVKKLEANS